MYSRNSESGGCCVGALNGNTGRERVSSFIAWEANNFVGDPQKALAKSYETPFGTLTNLGQKHLRWEEIIAAVVAVVAAAVGVVVTRTRWHTPPPRW